MRDSSYSTAKFLDAKLRSGNRGMDDAALEATLNDVLFLFRFTQGAIAAP